MLRGEVAHAGSLHSPRIAQISDALHEARRLSCPAAAFLAMRACPGFLWRICFLEYSLQVAVVCHHFAGRQARKKGVSKTQCLETIGVVAAPVPEPVSGWHLRLSVGDVCSHAEIDPSHAVTAKVGWSGPQRPRAQDRDLPVNIGGPTKLVVSPLVPFKPSTKRIPSRKKRQALVLRQESTQLMKPRGNRRWSENRERKAKTKNARAEMVIVEPFCLIL